MLFQAINFLPKGSNILNKIPLDEISEHDSSESIPTIGISPEFYKSREEKHSSLLNQIKSEYSFMSNAADLKLEKLTDDFFNGFPLMILADFDHKKNNIFSPLHNKNVEFYETARDFNEEQRFVSKSNESFNNNLENGNTYSQAADQAIFGSSSKLFEESNLSLEDQIESRRDLWKESVSSNNTYTQKDNLIHVKDELGRDLEIFELEEENNSKFRDDLGIFGSYSFYEPKQLGEGGCANVFSLKSSLGSQKAALKVLKPEIDLNLFNEAKSQDKLRGDAPQVYAMGQDSRSILMQQSTGVSFGEIVGDKKYSSIDFLPFFTQLLETLGTYHDKNVVHGDISGKNVNLIIEGNKITKYDVLDFGSAGPVGLVQDDNKFFTPNYAPPEVMSCISGDPCSDLYAVGLMILESYGFRPQGEIYNEFLEESGDNYLAVGRLFQILKDPNEHEKFESAYRGLPENIEPVVRKMTAKNVKDRYQTAQEASYALKDAMESEEIDFDVLLTELIDFDVLLTKLKDDQTISNKFVDPQVEIQTINVPGTYGFGVVDPQVRIETLHIPNDTYGLGLSEVNSKTIPSKKPSFYERNAHLE